MKVYDYGLNLHTRGRVRNHDLSGWRVVSLTPSHPGPVRGEPEDWAWHPLSDGRLTVARLSDVHAAVDAAMALSREGPTIVHCYAGRNRSVLVVGLAYARLTGRSGADALRHVETVRPNCLANLDFRDYLEAFG